MTTIENIIFGVITLASVANLGFLSYIIHKIYADIDEMTTKAGL